MSDDDIGKRSVRAIRRRGFNCLHNRPGRVIDDLPKDRVVTLEPGCRGGGYKELAPVCPLTATLARVSHGEHKWFREIELGVYFVVELVARAPHPGPCRVPALNHESGNNSVKNDIGVERPLAGLTRGGVGPLSLAGSKSDKILDGRRGVKTKESDRYVAVVCVQGRGMGVCSHALYCVSTCVRTRCGGDAPRCFSAFSARLCGDTGEDNVEIDRRTQRELNKLNHEAKRLWEEQREVLSHAQDLVRDASRTAGRYTTREVLPRAQETYRNAFESALAKLGKSAPQPKKSLSPLAYVLMAIGAIAVAALSWAAWQTLRADDDLWVEEDSE